MSDHDRSAVESSEQKRTIHVSRRGSITIQEPDFARYLEASQPSLGLLQSHSTNTRGERTSIVPSSSASSSRRMHSEPPTLTGSKLDVRQLQQTVSSSHHSQQHEQKRSQRPMARSSSTAHPYQPSVASSQSSSFDPIQERTMNKKHYHRHQQPALQPALLSALPLARSQRHDQRHDQRRSTQQQHPADATHRQRSYQRPSTVGRVQEHSSSNNNNSAHTH